MENTEREIIKQLAGNNRELRSLYKRHEELDRKIQEFQNLGFLTTKEQVEQKKLKSLKLRGVDRMMAIVRTNSSLPIQQVA